MLKLILNEFINNIKKHVNLIIDNYYFDLLVKYQIYFKNELIKKKI